MDMPRDHRGFTLVELVMIMVMIGIMVNIAAPLVRPERFRMDAAIVEVGSAFTAQQRSAILRQSNVVMAVDTAERRLRVHYDADNDGDMDSGEQWFVVQLGDGVVFGRGGAPARPLSPLTVSATRKQGGLPALTFRRNGSVNEEAILYLTSERGSPDETRALQIERATGRVSCYSYASGLQWVRTC